MTRITTTMTRITTTMTRKATTMRGNILLLFALLLASNLFATDLKGKKIYVNPGHGGWGPNDRPAATIPYPNLSSTGRPDTCGFYESNTDLWKCEELARRLRAAGADVTMSRTKNGPYPWKSDNVSVDPNTKKYNRNLSEICEEVCAGDFDYFLSVHSNAATDGSMTNYPLLLYKGYDKSLNQSPSYITGDSPDRAEKMWPYLFETMDKGLEYNSLFSKTKSYCKGDITFYGSSSKRWSVTDQVNYVGYLGVLKHSCPGFLSEGYFHTYQPARHRALNRDFCRQEGLRYYRGIAAYYDIDELKTGCIMGVIKSETEKIDNKLYTYKSGTHDQWLPLNGAVVTLYKGGKKISEYTVDNNYNGIFVFWDLEPGDDYTLEARCKGYRSLTDEYKVARTVVANETTYPRIYLTPGEDDDTSVADSYHYARTEQSTGTKLLSEYEFREVYADEKILELEDKTVRRALLKDTSSLYVLALDEANAPYLYLINPQTHKVVKQLSTAGTEGNILALSDINFTDDSVLVACNYGENWASADNADSKNESAVGSMGTTRFYYWNTDDSEPQVWFTSQYSAIWQNANVGRSFAVKGTISNATVIADARSIFNTKKPRLVTFTIKNGTVTENYNIQNETLTEYYKDDYHFNVNPLNENIFIITFDGGNTIELSMSATLRGKTTLGTVTALPQLGANYFYYDTEHALLVTPAADGNDNIGAALHNITDGWDSAVAIKSNTTLAPEPVAGSVFTAVALDYSFMDLVVLRNSKLTLFTTKPEQTEDPTDSDEPETPQIQTESTTHYHNPIQPNGTSLNSEYTFYEEYSNQTIDVLSGKTIRRAILKDANTLYILAFDNDNAPYLYSVNPRTLEINTQLSTQDLSGNILALSDITLTDDSLLVGCNMSENWFDDSQTSRTKTGSRGNIRFYYWSNENSIPQQWFSSNYSGNMYVANLGRSLAVKGTLANATVVTDVVSYASTSAPYNARIAVFTIKDGLQSGVIRMQSSGSVSMTDYFTSSDWQFEVSPIDESRFILTAEGGKTMEFAITESTKAPDIVATSSIPQYGSSYFIYAEKPILSTPVLNDSKLTGMALYDLSDGLNNANLVNTNISFDAQAVNGAVMSSVVVSGKDMDAFVLSQTINHFTTIAPLADPKILKVTDVSMEETSAGYVFRFTANTDVTSGKLMFYDETKSLVFEYDIPVVVTGENEVLLTQDDLGISEGQTWTWSVELHSRAITKMSLVFSDTERYTSTTSNMSFNTVDMSSTSDYYGRIYVFNQPARNSAECGMYVYDSEYNLLNETSYKGNQSWGRPFRMSIDANGKVYIPDWSDAHSGVYIADPNNLEGEFTQLFVGDRNSAGLFLNGTEAVGGSSPGLAVYGSGKDTKLIVYSEDTEPNNGLAIYQLGQEDGTILNQWTTAPTSIIELMGQANMNGNVVATAHGVFVSQNRSYNHNEEFAPSLLFYDYDGNMLFNSADDAISSYINGTSGSGFAVSQDESMLVLNDAAKQFVVFDIVYAENTLTLNYRATYYHGYDLIYQMNFDTQGRLVCTGASGLFVYQLPQDDNSELVAAAEKYAVSVPYNKYTISIISEHGLFTGDGEYYEGETAVLEIIPEEGWLFAGWTDGDMTNPRTVEVVGDQTYEAQFIEESIANSLRELNDAESDKIQKVVRDGHIYIIRNGKVYDITGKKM